MNYLANRLGKVVRVIDELAEDAAMAASPEDLAIVQEVLAHLLHAARARQSAIVCHIDQLIADAHGHEAKAYSHIHSALESANCV